MADGIAREESLRPPQEQGGGTIRRDGWTPERKRIFLETLAELGSVSDAARAADMSRKSAYRLRHRPEGQAFAMAWDGALYAFRHRFRELLMDRAVNGYTETRVSDGRVEEYRRFDNRLAMAMLTYLDGRRESAVEEDRISWTVSDYFGEFVDLVCAGGEGAAEFLARRHGLGWNRRNQAKLEGRDGDLHYEARFDLARDLEALAEQEESLHR
jgi:hypothetical protein